MTDPERLLFAHEAAVFLGISERTLARLIRTGGLPQPLRVGHRRRWRRTDLLAAPRASPLHASHRLSGRRRWVKGQQHHPGRDATGITRPGRSLVYASLVRNASLWNMSGRVRSE